MNVSAIYKIESRSNPERCYVGSAVNIKKRWTTHLNSLRKGTHHSIQLQRHYNKYGESDLVFIVLEPCLSQFLIIREQYYIDALNPYFNTCKIAGSTLGYHYSQEVINKIQESRKWYKPTKDTCNKISKSLEGNERTKGHKHKPESIEKIRNASTGENSPMFGKHLTESTKNKQRKAMIGKEPWNKGIKTNKPSWNTGLKNCHSEETLIILRKPKSELHKKHLREAHAKRWELRKLKLA